MVVRVISSMSLHEKEICKCVCVNFSQLICMHPNDDIEHCHYYILCPFAKGQTKNLKVLRKKNKKPKGFAKEKKFAKFAMQNASQLVAHHSSQI